MVNRSKTQFLFLIIVLIGVFIFVHSETFLIEASSVEPETSDTTVTHSSLIPLFWTVVFVGGTIATTLAYVSWRKYKGEEKKQTKKDNSVD